MSAPHYTMQINTWECYFSTLQPINFSVALFAKILMGFMFLSTISLNFLLQFLSQLERTDTQFISFSFLSLGHTLRHVGF